MSLGQQTGAEQLRGIGWTARRLPGPPLIAPARQFTFPMAVPGEEDALARGSAWFEVRTETAGTFLAQCALGFAGAGTADGLWPLPEPDRFLLCAGGYAYAIAPAAPESTTLLPSRPAVLVLPLPTQTILVTHHALLVREQGGELWFTPRLSWEGIALTSTDGQLLRGTGWNLMDDAEVPFTVDLRTRQAIGGGYASTGSAAAPADLSRR